MKIYVIFFSGFYWDMAYFNIFKNINYLFYFINHRGYLGGLFF